MSAPVIERLKHHLIEIDKRSTLGDELLLSLTGRGVVPRSQITDKDARAESLAGYKRCKRGDIVLNKMQAWNGMVALSDYDGIVSPDYAVFRVVSQLHVRWLHYVLRSDVLRSEYVVRSRGMGTAFNRLHPHNFLDIAIRVPDIRAQRTVADFLDRETTRIDSLIEKKHRTRTLLEDRLQTVISEVTRARWATEGVEDPLPRGWQFMALRRCLASSTYGIGEPSQAEGAIGVLGMANVDSREIVGAPTGYVMGVDPSLLLRPGDLLFNRTNSRELVGKVALVRQVTEPLTFASYLVRLRVSAGVDAAYLNYLLNSREVLSLARSIALPSIGQANLNPRRYAAIRIPLPATEAQRVAVRELEGRCAAVRATSDRLNVQMNLLQERRRGLITAAVTGRLDLPGAA